MTKGLIVLLIMMAMTLHAQEDLTKDLMIEWDAVSTDEALRALDTNMMEYTIMVSSNGGDYLLLAITSELFFRWVGVNPSCVDVYVKAQRTDTLQFSVPSSIASICVLVPGASGKSKGSASEGTLTLPPLPPAIRLTVYD